MQCVHYTVEYKCSLGLYNGSPGAKDCAMCRKFESKKEQTVKTVDLPNNAEEKKSEGVGDSLAKLTSAVGIKPCGGCKKRQQALNKLFPYGGTGPEPS